VGEKVKIHLGTIIKIGSNSLNNCFKVRASAGGCGIFAGL
jgi:hypothetical protein